MIFKEINGGRFDRHIRKNALLFTDAVCRPQPGAFGPFPEYFDWADQIAVERIGDYPYQRYLIRLAKDFKLISIKEYTFSANAMDGIGKSVGGWLKFNRSENIQTPVS